MQHPPPRQDAPHPPPPAPDPPRSRPLVDELLGIAQDAADTNAHPVIWERLDRLAEQVRHLEQRHRAVLADLDQVPSEGGYGCNDTCWREHPDCLAARIRRTLTGQETA